MMKLLATLALCLFLTSTAHAADVTTPGDELKAGTVISIIGFCELEKDMKHLSGVVAVEGDTGYTRIMRDIDSSCVDGRVLGSDEYINVTLVKKMWLIVYKTGWVYQVWKFKDVDNKPGYTWVTTTSKQT